MLKIVANIFLIFLIAFMLLFVFWQAPVDYFKQFVTDNSELSVIAFIFLVIISEVLAPVTVLPLVPVAALFFGSFYTAIYTIIGWEIGAMLSFWVGRYLGKPVLDKFVVKTKMMKYKKYVPQDIGFWWVVFLRMVIPVDVLSYLIALFTKMNFTKFALATLVGIIPFSFVFAYGFEILFFKNIPAVILTSLFLIAILPLIWYFHKKGRI